MKVSLYFALPIVVLVLVTASPANADLIFFDDFDQDATDNGTTLNFGSFDNWTVDRGTVDLIESGGFGINCVESTGGCVDLDGSTSDAGRIYTTNSFQAIAGTYYTLFFDVSGNQRGQGDDSILFGFLYDDLSPASISPLTLGDSDPFGVFTGGGSISFSGFSPYVHIYFEGVGGDNVGLILDNVMVCSSGTGPVPVPCDLPSVPEPATLLLLGGGLFAVAYRARRKP